MILRTKNGNFKADNSILLLDFLGVRKEMVGIQKVTGDVELIASVPFQVIPFSIFPSQRFGVMEL
jgi:hypothetical protein